MHNYHASVLTAGLAFPEAPRWHDGRLWFTDQHARTICALDDNGLLDVIARTDDLPGGLAWLSDGRMLVVYMTERRVMQWTGGGFETYANLTSVASFHCNDMVVDARDNLYVGNFGFDLHGGAPQSPAELIRIDNAGGIECVANDVLFPNGGVVMADGRRLLLAETFAHRLTLFGFDDDGQVISRETWAELGDATPDGICVDAEGAAWIASPGNNSLIRVKQGGAIVARCTTRGTPYACALGGDDKHQLLICTSETDDPQDAARLRSGRIEQARVDVAGVGP